MTEELYLGVDLTSGKRPWSLVALDGDLRIVERRSGPMEAILEFVQPLEAAVVAVDAPAAPSAGLMRQTGVRRRLGLTSRDKRWADWRVCEFELRRRNLRLYHTPSSVRAAPGWMRAGFKFYRRLESLGFIALVERAPQVTRLHLEVHPHACFAVLLGRRPVLKSGLEGRMQRQMTLYMEGIDLPNPTDAFEAITRQTILQGRWPLEDLLDHDDLDALAGAYTAYLARQRPGRISQVGERDEGLITLPADELLDFYA